MNSLDLRLSVVESQQSYLVGQNREYLDKLDALEKQQALVNQTVIGLIETNRRLLAEKETLVRALGLVALQNVVPTREEINAPTPKTITVEGCENIWDHLESLDRPCDHGKPPKEYCDICDRGSGCDGSDLVDDDEDLDDEELCEHQVPLWDYCSSCYPDSTSAF